MVEKVAPPRWNLVKGQLISVSSNLLKNQLIFLRISALKVRQDRNDFFKSTFPPKKKRTNSKMRLVFFCFFEEIEDTKKTF